MPDPGKNGTGIKQLEPVDASNHSIMDYSIHDAIEKKCQTPGTNDPLIMLVDSS